MIPSHPLVEIKGGHLQRLQLGHERILLHLPPVVRRQLGLHPLTPGPQLGVLPVSGVQLLEERIHQTAEVRVGCVQLLRDLPLGLGGPFGGGDGGRVGGGGHRRRGGGGVGGGDGGGLVKAQLVQEGVGLLEGALDVGAQVGPGDTLLVLESMNFLLFQLFNIFNIHGDHGGS